MTIDDNFDDSEDIDEKLRMQGFIKENEGKFPKLSPSGEAKMREALRDVKSGNVLKISLPKKGYCALYGEACHKEDITKKTKDNYCSKNLDCGHKDFFALNYAIFEE